MGWIPSAGPESGNSTAQSTNWSGYAVTGGNGAFNSVSATWVEPKAKCNGTKYAAFWVGLDGYNSDSVEQTGSDSDCTGSSPTYYGWYEMFPANPVYYTNTVKRWRPLPRVVAFSGTDTYTLVLHDVTQGWTHKVKKTSSGDARSSAEVITEAPSSNTRRAAACQLRHRRLHGRQGQRHADELAEPGPDHHDRQQRPGQGLDQHDHQRWRLPQHVDQGQLT